MATERVKLKELALELETTELELKNTVREFLKLSTSNKNIASVSVADAERLRNYYKEKRASKDNSKKQDVIVRRRRDKGHDDGTKKTGQGDAAGGVGKKEGSESGDRKRDGGTRSNDNRERNRSRTDHGRRQVEEKKARIIATPGQEQKAKVIRLPNQEPPQAKDKALAEVPPASQAQAKPVAESSEVQAKVSQDQQSTEKAKAKDTSQQAKTGAEAKETKETKEERRHQPKRERQDQDKERDTTPKVRIISRPTAPAAAKKEKEERSEGGKYNRDRSNRQGNNAQRQGRGQRQGATGGGFRQQQSVPMPDMAETQSKKKRLKRRTVDFQQGDFGQNDDDEVPRMTRSRGKRKPNRQQSRPQPQVVTQPIKAAKRKVKIVEFITVAEMAKQMGLKATELIKVLLASFGVMATINQALDYDTASLVAQEFGYEVERTGFSEEEYLANKAEDNPENLKPRPPVVTIMGHVDHGKTSLLDAIRKSHVTSGEAGGITQHIGAYHVKTKRGDIVFLDTPGHEAFTAMRARGAQITDLVILVVAADDGVMEQTREAINHSKAAKVPIMVAVNKMDKPGADPDRVLRELAELGLQPEDWGGDTIVAKVSAKTRQGLDELLEMVALQSEIMELKANPDKPARGHIIEARLDKGRGPVATVLIQEGTLHHGDNFVCGQFSGRVRSLLNDQGKKVKEAGPSIPVEVQGIEGVPEAGEEFIVVQDEKLARRIADVRASKQRERELAKESRVTLETFLARVGDTETMTLNLVVKADVQGSLEAITEALNKLSTDKVAVHVVHGGTGAISESDILLASASQAIIIGFNVRPTAKIKDVAEHENVDIRFYNIIYKLVEDIQSAMQGLLAPVQREVYLGQAEVRNTFNLPKIGTIAGCYVADGKIQRNAGVRLLRDGVVVYTGKIASLKRFKDDAREVVKGNECGAGLENFNDIKIGDILEAFETVEEAAKL
ncbi:MAG: translation initiation factor IF-2 [Desulfovibrionaceae bacterium]|nr:translation initiation factor IF-2 [Desulfovibrionaceae bacterium]